MRVSDATGEPMAYEVFSVPSEEGDLMTKSVLFKPIPLDMSRPKILRSSILPLSSDALILPNAVIIIRGAPWQRLKPHIFWVDSGCAPFFDINDIRIGIESQTTSYGAIPASMFALRHIKNVTEIEGVSVNEEVITPGYRVEWPIIEVGQLIDIHVHNCSDTPRRFRAALEGHVQY